LTLSNREEIIFLQSKISYESIVEEQSNLISRFLPDGSLIFVNNAFCEFYAMKRENLIGRNWFSFLPEREEKITRRKVKTLSPKKNTLTHEFSKKNNGEIQWIENSIKAIFDENGKLYEYQNIASDITIWKKSEQLQTVLLNVVNAINNFQDLDELFIMIRDFIGLIIDTKNFFVALYDEKKHRISLPFQIDEKDKFKSFPAGKTLTAYVIKTKKSLLATEEKINELKEAGEIEIIGTISKIWLGVPLFIGQEIMGIVSIQSYSDEHAYTEKDLVVLEFLSGQIAIAIAKKRDEEMIIKQRNRARFFNDLLAHDTNNFNHGITSFLGMVLATGGLPKKIRQRIETCKHLSEEIAALITKVRIFAEIDEEEIELIPVDFKKTLLSSINSLKIQHSNKKKINFSHDFVDGKFNVLANEFLEIVINNLLNNAIKHCHKDEVMIEVKHSILKDNKYCRIEFRDDGTGIADNDKTSIFKRLERAGAEKIVYGFGLGLTLVKNIIKSYDGRIWVEDRVDGDYTQGSNFVLLLPISNKN